MRMRSHAITDRFATCKTANFPIESGGIWPAPCGTVKGMDNGGAVTDRLIAQAQIPQGARALDVGCGNGMVTFRLAAAVGAQGRVLGIDPNEKALAAACQKASADSVANVAFAAHDLFAFARSGQRFDVVMCRRVLMYLPDQIAAAKAFKALLKPDGCLIVQEHDASMAHSTAPLPLAQQASSWIWDTVKAEGANPATGFDLPSILRAAGFTAVSITAEAIVETPGQRAATAQIVRIMLSRIEAAGVATAQEIDIETLEDRLDAERHLTAATSVSEMIFGAVAR